MSKVMVEKGHGDGYLSVAGLQSLVSGIWRQLKVWRRVNLGPVALFFRAERAVHVTSNTAKRLSRIAQTNESGRCSDSPTDMKHPVNDGRRGGVALVVGVGPGFGHALVHRLASEGFQVVMASRNALRLDKLVDEIRAEGGSAFAYGCDATAENSVLSLFANVQDLHAVPDLVVYSLQSFGPGQAIDIAVPAFEEGWRHNCLGAFLVARSAARAMQTKGCGTIVLVGSTSSMLGRAGHLNLAVGKFGQRALSQVLARELWPKGIHVAHVVIDADIDEGDDDHDELPRSNPNDIAQLIVDVHRQPKSAWMSEADIRPWNEQFWQHC